MALNLHKYNYVSRHVNGCQGFCLCLLFLRFSIGFWNCSDSELLFAFHLFILKLRRYSLIHLHEESGMVLN